MGDIQQFLKDIPACIRCRKNHRGCDASLPRCRNCVKAGVEECLYHDHILDRKISRRQVVSYLILFRNSYVESNCLFSHILSLSTRVSELRAQQQSGVYECPAEIPTLMQKSGVFFGPRSCVAEAARSPVSVPLRPSLDQSDPLILMLQVQDPKLLTAELHGFLVRNYLSTIHRLYPILDDADPALLPTRLPAQESATVNHLLDRKSVV